YDPSMRLMSFSKAYRAVAERRSAYAAMTVWGYSGVRGFYDPSMRLMSFSKAYRAVAKRRGAYAAMTT
ncbi:MAG TPA: hypothetical protein PLU70_07860, partial [Thermotogota bacterium]|nr:hypothetical protein [Thermotogota bacterium]HQI99352.1 hypothetical protein [Thermotogota bacterium]